MIKRVKTKLVVLLACIAASFLFGGCTLGTTLDEIVQTNHLEAQVTYYANGGKFDGGDVKQMYYKADSLVFELGFMNTTNGTATAERAGYDLEGWYYIEVDEQGNPIKENGELKFGGKVDFTQRIQSGEHWYIAPKWIAQVRLDVKLVCDDGAQISIDGITEPCKKGDIVKSYSYDAGTDIVQGFSAVADETGNYAFADYYFDEACTQPVIFPIAKEENQTENAVVYAKFIDKSWTVVRDSEQIRDVFSNTQADKKYWISRDIDANGIEIAPVESFACEMQGNGYTISNLTVVKTGLQRNEVVSFLGNIEAPAVLKNITFENLQGSYKYDNKSAEKVKAYFVCASMEAGATVEGVAFTGESSKVTVSLAGGSNRPTTGLYGEGVSADTFDTSALNLSALFETTR